jgi:hypothetical protein
MTLPHLGQQNFIDFLIANGCQVVSDNDWEDFDRIMLKKDDISFPLQMKKVYYYYFINKICDDLGIEPPEECRKVSEQIKNMNKESD